MAPATQVQVNPRTGTGPTPASRIPSARLDPATEGRVTLRLGGSWRLDRPLPEVANLARDLDAATPAPMALTLDCTGLTDWDSGLVAYLLGVRDLALDRGLALDEAGLPAGVKGLLHLATAVPDRSGGRPAALHGSFLREAGEEALGLVRSTGEIMAFLGEVILSLRRLLKGQARLRRADLWLAIQEAGAQALPIVSLVNFLVGMILAYVGAQQLARFGARILVADLVGLATVIQMGALVTAIVLAGRTGAAYAAHIGTMQVNEEIDALRTLGLSPMDFLVLPRMLALLVMTPLLTVYADLMGILGGALVGVLVGGVTPTEYVTQTQAAIGWNHIIQGLISATFYGAIVAVSGCLRGMQCGRSAAAVGEATTSAVVTAIVFIVIAAAVLTVVFNALGLS
jgi:phospholipid/cholesterol/gamma-HCH transport system permease protein